MAKILFCFHVSSKYLLCLIVNAIFLMPRGYAEISSEYSIFLKFSTWLGVAIIILSCILRRNFNHISFNIKNPLWLYFVATAVITYIDRSYIDSGFQQLFAYPIYFIFCVYCFKNCIKIMINSMSIIFILNYILNLAICCIYSLKENIIFLGHIQVVSQLCALSIFFSLLYLLRYRECKFKYYFLICISLLTMLLTETDVSFYGAIFIIVFLLFSKSKLISLFLCRSEYLIYLGVLFSLIIIYISVFSGIFEIYTFSGRRFIWYDALSCVGKQLFFGYGIDGILLHTFWTGFIEGFNYAHNQILQNLLDGGVVVTVLFWWFVIRCVNPANRVSNLLLKSYINFFLLIFLLIMIVESVSFYVYFYVFLAYVSHSNLTFTCNKS